MLTSYIVAFLIGVLVWICVPRAEGDNVANPFNAPWPHGRKIRTRVSFYAPNGLSAAIVSRLKVPFDCYVDKIWLAHTKNTVVIDAISAITVDAAKNVLGSYAPADSLNPTAMTVHADVANKAYMINGGDVIHFKATTTTGSSAGWVDIDLDLIPAYA